MYSIIKNFKNKHAVEKDYQKQEQNKILNKKLSKNNVL